MPAKDNDRLRRITFSEAIREATVQAMDGDDTVLALGLGVTDPKGVFGTTLGLKERFGEERAYDIPVSENAVTGICVGLAISGFRPILSHQRADFMLMSMDQIINNVAKWNYMFGGQDSVEPFLEYRDKGVLVWCRSSNPGARELQDLISTPPQGGDSRPFYEWVAISAAKWNTHGNVGLVVGATYPDELENIRDLCPDMPILIPGVGAQEGSLERSTMAGIDVRGRNAMVSASRGVLYAGKDPATYPDEARKAALQLRDRMNAMLEDRNLGWSR